MRAVARAAGIILSFFLPFSATALETSSAPVPAHLFPRKLRSSSCSRHCLSRASGGSFLERMAGSSNHVLTRKQSSRLTGVGAPPRKKGCTDAPCLLLLLACWAGVGYVTYLSLQAPSDYRRVVHGCASCSHSLRALAARACPNPLISGPKAASRDLLSPRPSLLSPHGCLLSSRIRALLLLGYVTQARLLSRPLRRRQLS